MILFLLLAANLFGGIYAGYIDRSDFGFDPAPTIMVEGSHRLGMVEISARGEVSTEAKSFASNGTASAYDARFRLHSPSGLCGVIGWRQTGWRTEEASKVAQRPLAGLCYEKGWRIEGVYFAKDSSVNRSDGFSLDFRYPATSHLAFDFSTFYGQFQQGLERWNGLAFRVLVGFQFQRDRERGREQKHR